jgi:hypothetical protein
MKKREKRKEKREKRKEKRVFVPYFFIFNIKYMAKNTNNKILQLYFIKYPSF